MCGLFGIINTKPRKFDYATFCTLGIANDDRGGDSCGFFIDGHYEYGTGKDNKYFQCFFPDNDYLNTLDSCTIALGHCRKASVGKIDVTTAQPVIIKNNDKVEYVLMHNGTITNYKELAIKYIPEVDIKDMTDSQVMAQIFYHKGYDALVEYKGAAVFVIADYRTNKVLFFKGLSKKYSSSKEEEERPLFYTLNEKTGELVFSSISSYLMSLRHKQTCWILPSNTLLEYSNREFNPIATYDRTKIVQQKINNKYSYNLYQDWYNLGSYITTNLNNNTYSNETLLQGPIILTCYGLIKNQLDDYNTKIYFWQGIPLRGVGCFKFLQTLKKKSGLSNKDFLQKYLNLIRFMSIDQIYQIDNIWYKAINPSDKELYTGDLKFLCSNTTLRIEAGHKISTLYGNFNNEVFNMIPKLSVDFKLICKYLTKQHNNG